ncbi:MAG: chromosome segregation SMC family protein [Nanoarchaeota archaeon]
MPYIKSMVLKGFKSFPKETSINFDKTMNIIVGPNGSGKSNIVDALCFVLGRMRIKSMRAAKSAHLIFTGTSQVRPASEASVMLILDNSDKKFSIDNREVAVERIVRNSGQSIYKINGKTGTRQEVLELLAQAEIDPYGFNIVLQGEINSIIKMHPEERRKIIEEVAGISIYEIRKEKSLHELEKTEEKLKEIQTTLRERTLYLKNLEEERQQALRYRKLEESVKRYKTSILKRKLDDKNKELETINKQQEEKDKAKSNLKEKEQQLRKEIENLERDIEKINLQIRESSGIEQDKLNEEISDIRADLAGLNVRKENNEKRLQEILARRQKSEQEIKNSSLEIEKLRKEFPSQSRKYQELEKKKKELSEAEKERKKSYNLKEKLNSLKEITNEKKKQFEKNNNESSFLLKEIERMAVNLTYKEIETCKNNIAILKKQREEKLKDFNRKQSLQIEQEKTLAVYSAEISNLEKIKKQISSLDICPLCKTKITAEHIESVFKDCDDRISEFQKKVSGLKEVKEEEMVKLKQEVDFLYGNISKAEIDLVKLENAEERKEQIKRLEKERASLQEEIRELAKEIKSSEAGIEKFKDIEEKYDELFLQIQEISSRTQENISTEAEFKERDLEKTRLIIKQIAREKEELEEESEEFSKEIEEKENLLDKREEENSELEKEYEKFIGKKTSLDKRVHEINLALLKLQNEISLVDNEINEFKINTARLNAEKENLETDFLPYTDVGIINLPLYTLQEKLQKAEIDFRSLGPVNLRALEVYNEIKKEYDKVAEKISVLEKEKGEIMKVIAEIDNKKKKTFTTTLKAVNELFNRNFTQLSIKGEVFLEPENPEDIFSAGLDVVVKIGKGKYFDVTSLSGGEQTLVALSLIFAIQEYKPYCFYILDEVDAALDKRNSERLAGLIKRYMKTGQYIVITHNDAIITESTTLYGVTMQEGISKILSLEI